LPKYLWKVKFDLIVFETLFMCTRWDRKAFGRNCEKVRMLKEMEAKKIALPQDEFINTDILCEFINEIGVETVFSVAPPSEWSRIYSGVDKAKVTFYRVLPGYLDKRVLAGIKSVDELGKKRTVDIGYRTAGRPYPWFGRHGYLKQKVAERVSEKAVQKGLVTDISTDGEDTILGDEWYRFLLNCKYTIGAEGGTSILDHDGTIHKKTEAYLQEHPGASFEEVESECFPGLDGNFRLFAISPRHLEACATRTCQILTTGDYNRILDAGKHFIELSKDFTNLEEVLECVVDDHLRGELTEQAYEDIVASGKYSYEAFVDFVIKHSLSQ